MKRIHSRRSFPRVASAFHAASSVCGVSGRGINAHVNSATATQTAAMAKNGPHSRAFRGVIATS